MSMPGDCTINVTARLRLCVNLVNSTRTQTLIANNQKAGKKDESGNQEVTKKSGTDANFLDSWFLVPGFQIFLRPTRPPLHLWPWCEVSRSKRRMADQPNRNLPDRRSRVFRSGARDHEVAWSEEMIRGIVV